MSKELSSLSQRRLLVSTFSVAVASLSLGALAQEAQEPVTKLESLTIEGQAQQEGFKTEQSASRKYTAPLLDTPQTVNTVPAQVIQDQQALSLRSVLSNVSGITFNAGEGGGGSGDSINIRGFSANSNIQIDGLRDSTQNNRTDTFNLESVEVIKGPNSVFGGAGTTGGSINLISKKPQERQFTRIGAGLGTDSYRRLTLDTNQPLQGVGTDSAFRLNLMAHENDVPSRDKVDRERWGIAPSLALGLSDDTRLTLSYFHQTDNNLPDYGVPVLNGKRLAGVDHEDYFGYSNIDHEDINNNVFTVELEHRFNDNLSLQNLTRYSRIQRDTVISAPQLRLIGGGRYLPGGPQGYGRDITSEMWTNQTNLTGNFDTLGLGHAFVLGAEFSREDYDRDTYTENLVFPASGYSLSNPPGRYAGPTNQQTTALVSNTLVDKAVYAFDTIALNDHWDVNLGLRYDWFDGDSDSTPVSNGVRGAKTQLSSDDGKLSGRAGLVFKPAPNGRIYVAYGTSFNPSAENLTTTGAGLSATNQDLEPEKNKTWELGTKWEFLDRRLELDGALFRVEKTNARETLADNSIALVGEQRVQGIELGATGRLTQQWNVYANFTFLDSETLKAADTAAGRAREGQALANTPPRSFNLWTTYELPAGWRVGYGTRYVSERNLTSNDDGIKLDQYWLHNAMLGYRVNRNLDLQLNVNNLFDKEYVERVRSSLGTSATGTTAASSSFIEYGDARAAILTATYSF
ncbi:TonB-dependent siderophore receptor [Pseudomonas oryzihabitans]|uniref:TonB-dependent receptor n=1 Tax=Pseudomonas oryzihabitans TaxID=47885 RepID=UPI00289405F0|nr:TonB-dependent siderophore receptor [Pseudomonas oryzihabitans]MDT3718663.1 TonB-dependent siderophore receptor [Pseudomonas oryzihabitans]